MQKATLLDFNQDYWKRFIKGGKLDKEALVKAGYDNKGQPEWIEAEMVKLGWLPGAKEVEQFAADPAYKGNTPPLSERKQREKEEAEKAKAKGPKTATAKPAAALVQVTDVEAGNLPKPPEQVAPAESLKTE